MADTEVEKYFGVVDIVIFVALLFVSATIGAFFAYRDRRNKTTETYYFGNRNISPFPVAMSMAVSFVSALTVIGFPVEVYLYGTVICWVIMSWFFEASIGAVYYIPIIFRLKLNSIYEYLELRYSRFLRKLVSGMTILNMITYMGITVYLPALALSAVTPISMNWSIALTSIICTFYTSVGGMKAVIWTDVIQGFIMVFGSLAVFIKTVILVGGFENLTEAVERGGRNNFLYFEPDPRYRSTAFTMFFGPGMLALSGSCCSQVYAQRYLSCKSACDAKKAIMMRIIPQALVTLLAIGNGLAMYAYYEGCDPASAGIIQRKDQTTPRMALEIFYDMPGMAGLFVSAAYSGTLSTVSSGINALSALSLEDFIKPYWPNMSSHKSSIICRVLSVVLGILVMIVAFVTSNLKSTVIQIAMSIGGAIGGPIFCAYSMGIFVPWTNAIGATVGILAGWIISAWVSVAAIIIKPSPEFRQTLPLTTDGCNFTSSYINESTTQYESYNFTTKLDETVVFVERPPLADTLYSLSPFMYGVLGYCTGVVVTILVSLLTGIDKPKDANPALFLPIIDNKKIFPKKMIKFFRFGVPEYDEDLHGIKRVDMNSEEKLPMKNGKDKLNDDDDSDDDYLQYKMLQQKETGC